MPSQRLYRFFALLIVCAMSPHASGDQSAARITPARETADGCLLHLVESPTQAGETDIRILLPDETGKDERCAVLYVLPVEPRGGNRWGDGLAEIKRHNLHNRYRLICVAPSFSDWPWYADHPTDKTKRQEEYFVEIVVPFIEKTYPVRPQRDARMLIGFSKSGWGAFSLLLRHPNLFGAAAAWDAPLMMQQPNRFGMEKIFATQENFEPYRITSLLEKHAAQFKGSPARLVHTGYGSFREHHLQCHKLMTELEIPHEFRDGPQRKHHWDSGWVKQAVELLVAEDR